MHTIVYVCGLAGRSEERSGSAEDSEELLRDRAGGGASSPGSKRFGSTTAPSCLKARFSVSSAAEVLASPVDGPQEVGFRETRISDPNKARQAERLGMGVGRVG